MDFKIKYILVWTWEKYHSNQVPYIVLNVGRLGFAIWRMPQVRLYEVFSDFYINLKPTTIFIHISNKEHSGGITISWKFEIL